MHTYIQEEPQHPFREIRSSRGREIRIRRLRIRGKTYVIPTAIELPAYNYSQGIGKDHLVPYQNQSGSAGLHTMRIIYETT